MTSELTPVNEKQYLQTFKYIFTWDKEEVPKDWNKGINMKLPRKGDIASLGNWEGSNFNNSFQNIIKGIAQELDNLLCEEQIGFKAGRSTTEQIFHSTEHCSTSYRVE
jgi:hypothetical protein